MKPLLKKYLALGIALQLVVALIVDFGGMVFGEGFRQMGMALPYLTVFILSIRHWAFVWPVAALLLTVALVHVARTEGILLHLFAGMMLAALVIIMTVSLAFFLPMMAMTGNLAH